MYRRSPRFAAASSDGRTGSTAVLIVMLAPNGTTVWPSSLFAQSFSVMLVDVKFVRERIGTVLFDYLVGAGDGIGGASKPSAFGLEVERCFVFRRPQAPMSRSGHVEESTSVRPRSCLRER